MGRRQARQIVLGTLFAVAVCLLARPASAMPAPFCDDRGATLLASAPPLQATDLDGLRTVARPACADDGLTRVPTLAPGRSPRQLPSSQGEPAVPCFPTPVVSPAGEPLVSPPALAPPTDGVPWRVERPPRV